MLEGALKRRCCLRRSSVLAAIVLLLILLFHGPVLRHVPAVLVFDDGVETADIAVLLGHRAALDRAAELYRNKNVRKIAVVERSPRRSARVGATPSFATGAISGLVRRGIPREAIETIRTGTRTDEQAIVGVGRWLQGQPDADAVVVVPLHRTRLSRNMINSVLGEDCTSRLHLVSFQPQSYDERKWWLSRTGIECVAEGYLMLMHSCCIGEDKVLPNEWDADEYEQSL